MHFSLHCTSDKIHIDLSHTCFAVFCVSSLNNRSFPNSGL